MKDIAPKSVMRYGTDGWELWRYPSKGEPFREKNISVKALTSALHLVVGLPTRSLLISSRGYGSL